MTHVLYQVDAFTEEPFAGNPAGVCLLGEPQPDGWMQGLAMEMNLSETAFLLPEGNQWRLRWFTPKTEVDLCGHATLASAKVLFEIQPVLRDAPLVFQTKSGELRARWVDGLVELDFPRMHYKPLEVPPKVAEALGFMPSAAVYSGTYSLYEAEDAEIIRTSTPDFDRIEALPIPEVIITAQSEDPEFDFISRFFAPQLGVDEDPVTGSAHCLLAPYWSEKTGKSELVAYQASQRGGRLLLRLAADRVRITGAAKVIFKADLLV
jgi:PhzF family phenazine biosynthesis protein